MSAVSPQAFAEEWLIGAIGLISEVIVEHGAKYALGSIAWSASWPRSIGMTIRSAVHGGTFSKFGNFLKFQPSDWT
jgi:hypothetical protein